ncbi:hypothetical protein [Undibacterium sp. WLX3042]|uniref:hypothetical protein n=1 Tax=Undibacterium sp. WLX3042 TaxID=3412686 RepID=UPI003C2BAA2F
MDRRINTIFDCLTHLTSLPAPYRSLQKDHIDQMRNVEDKLFAVAPFLWKSGGKDGFTLQAYRRKDALGFCLLTKEEIENEGLPKGGRAHKNFLEIKPDEALDFYRRNHKNPDHPSFDSIRFDAFLKLSSTDFIKLFLGAAQSRAENTNTFIY